MFYISSWPLCPAQALILSLRRCNSPTCAPLFSYLAPCGWLPLSASLFQLKLSQCLATIKFNPAEYSGHSFRRGGATFTLECGFPVDIINAQGDWASNSYERYLNPSWSMGKHLAATLGKRVVHVTGHSVSWCVLPTYERRLTYRHSSYIHGLGVFGRPFHLYLIVCFYWARDVLALNDLRVYPNDVFFCTYTYVLSCRHEVYVPMWILYTINYMHVRM